MRLIIAGIAVLLAGTASGQGRIIEDIRITADDDEAIIILEFACEMRFVADTPTAGGALLEVRMAPFDSCRQQGIGTSITTESYVPVGASEAHLVDIEYDSLGLGDGVVSIRFDQAVSYSITQRPTLRQVQISVDLTEEPVRRPSSIRVVEPSVTPDFMINLQSTRETIDEALAASIGIGEGQRLYISQIRLDGVLWNRLRLGFFESEAAARSALIPYTERFPRAWIGRAEPAEIALAEQASLPQADGRLVTLSSEQLEDSELAADADRTPLSAAEIESMMTAAREALIDGENEIAIATYSRLTRADGSHREQAIEFLGLAYERTGQLSRARSEYQRHLREFPESTSRLRVEQRLNSVVAMLEAPRETLREPGDASESAWDWSTGFSQYYRRDESQFDQDQPTETTQSALLTDADFQMSRTGNAIDLVARLSFNHYHDMLDPSEGGRGDHNRVSYAYFDIAEAGQQWSVRLGRQSLHTWGVLGRFDGAHFSYDVGNDKSLHVTAGYPVESTRHSVETSRQFAGVAVEFTDLVGTWDVSAFVNSQTIDGVDARMAVGTEARYFDERRNLTAMLDYDLDFGDLNMVLVLGTWRLPNRMTLSALIDQRKSPLLSTRNALIGQPVETVEELLLVWTEEEIRQLALDRTAESSTVTLGLAKPFGERLQLNFDLTTSEIDSTSASAGVAAVPGTGAQVFASTSLVATGLFGSGDVNIWSLRLGNADAYETKVLTWDARFPVGRRWRINPRVRFVLWQSLSDSREREGINPSLRFLLNAKNRYRLEFEFGQDVTTRTVAGGERESRSSFVNLGYRASF